jgi:hypothetical protein
MDSDRRVKFLEYQRQYHRQWYRLHRDRIKLYPSSDPEYHRNWYEQNGIKRTELQRQNLREYKKKFPEKVWAMAQLSYALQTGRIVKPELCEKCYLKRKLLAHHEDYSKPLDVNWWCYSCHKKYHLEIRGLETAETRDLLPGS